MNIIYEPKGRAREYAELAANLYSGCAHGCEYCYAPGALRVNRTDFRLCVKPRKDCLQQLEKDAAKLAPDELDGWEIVMDLDRRAGE